MSKRADRYFDERMETLSPEVLRKLQDHRLRWQFRRCWDGSAWYRARFEAAGLTPETFGGLADLARLPLLTDSELRSLDDASWLVAPTDWIASHGLTRSPGLRHYSGGDFTHERDRAGRAHWAASTRRPPILMAYPEVDFDSKTDSRRYGPPQSHTDRATPLRLLHDDFIGGYLAHMCAERTGKHWADDHLLAEIINPKSAQSIADGTAGELVVTDLMREANPLIRYRTGLRRVFTREPCACGRTSSLIWTAQAFRAAKNSSS